MLVDRGSCWWVEGVLSTFLVGLGCGRREDGSGEWTRMGAGAGLLALGCCGALCSFHSLILFPWFLWSKRGFGRDFNFRTDIL